MKKAQTFLFIMLLSLTMNHAFAENQRKCASTQLNDIKTCLKKESATIDDANLPNEILFSAEENAREAMIQLIEEFTAKRNDPYSLTIKNKLEEVKSAVAVALIIQYEDEPQLYYYYIDSTGTLHTIFDGLNSIDISENFPTIFKNNPSAFYLNNKNVSPTFIEWLDFLKEN